MSSDNFYYQFFNIRQSYPHQQATWEAVNSTKFPLLIKAPSGSGKTEAILAPFLSQFISNQFDIAPRLIYVLPMRVLVNSVAERIEKYAKRISQSISVKVHHGDVPNSPFFIADIVVTTLDQFLYGFARASSQVGKHIDMPAGSIASSMIVFDEAHMYRDEFTFSIMRAILEILYQSRIPFVVMTATMPESLEKSLFENIKDYHQISGNDVIQSTLTINMPDTPLYSSGQVNIPDDVLEKVKTKKTLIVLNQVKRAQRVYEEIKQRLDLSDEQIVLLHSRFTKKDRQQHEKKALSLIPNKVDGTMRIPDNIGVVISTQVLEAGIDFSAELLLTELAPADCLVQRAGRCARYEGEKGEMIIFPVENEKGYLPYKKEHLSKTLAWLQSHPDFNIKNFNEVCSFVSQTLDYQANDYEARDTLIDLYECVLYADSEPRNIQLRDGKSATIVVLDIPESGKGKIEDKIKAYVLNNPSLLKDNFINVDIGIVWALFNDGNRPIQWEIQWRYNEKKEKEIFIFNLIKGKKKPDEKDSRIDPFRTYIIDSKYYKQDKGIYPDVSFII
ncbi:MAG TPA: CRISPR-associated helicase Cas3' [bacterium]|nr:CRISPR-associated helicase Cas3' [bacterium]HOL35595.1 CRISPR-associated helicase Cas3' [bacterium]HPP08970.1 CRISPR-associated helicase Cas3' [bacterium]